MYNALIVEKNDDVAVVLEAIHVGDKVTYRYGDEERSVVSLSEVPVYHKVAVRDIKRGTIFSSTARNWELRPRILSWANMCMYRTWTVNGKTYKQEEKDHERYILRI